MKYRKVVVVVLLFCASVMQARSASEAPPSHEDVSKVTSFLFVQNATSGTYKGGRLTLHEAGPVIFFSDRPYRVFGHVTPERLVSAWSVGDNNFASDPPNATLSILGADIEDSIVVLSDPTFDGKTFSYKVEVLEGTIPAKFKHASLFIDNNLWAAVGGLAVGRVSARRRDAAVAASYQAGQQSATAATYQNSSVSYTAQPAAPCPPPKTGN